MLLSQSETIAQQENSVFSSFLQAGFECSTQRTKSGHRLDLVASTSHDVLAEQDYQQLHQLGIRTVREGLRWHLLEPRRGQYDFSSMLPLLDAAQETGTEQIVDLLHFGWPDFLDIFDPDFVECFSQLAHQFARLLHSRGVARPWIAPINEISFVSWAAGDVAYLNPFQQGRGHELKRQLVRASIRAIQAFQEILPGSRFLFPDPVIHITSESPDDESVKIAEYERMSMYEAWDMLSGRIQPELGGSREMLQTIGVNFYDRNQRTLHGRVLNRDEELYRPFHLILAEIWERYRVPIVISETGTEDGQRAAWFAYVADQVRRAIQMGVRVEGICLYPIVNHPGWDDDRHCYNGLFDYPGPNLERELYQPLAKEIARQQDLSFGVYSS